MSAPVCGHECACPSALHHEVAALLAEWNAPLPRARMTAGRIMGEIDAMLQRSLAASPSYRNGAET